MAASAHLAQTSSASDTSFSPRLRLDLNSGHSTLRSLNESVAKLRPQPKLPLPPAGAADDPAFAPVAPVIDFDRTIALMKGRHTQGMHERHVTSLKKIISLNARGFFLHDLESTHTLLELCVEHMRNGLDATYGSIVCELLQTLSMPFQKQRSSDHHRFAEPIATLMRTGASLGLEGGPLVAGAALEMLLSLAVPPPPPASTAEALAREALAVGPRIETLQLLKLLVTSGAVPPVVGAVHRCLAESAQAAPLRPSARSGSHLGTPPVWERPLMAALRLLRAVARTSDGALAIVQSSDVSSLLDPLRLPLGSPLLAVGVELVWNLVESAPELATDWLCAADGMPTLSALHQRTLVPGGSETDRELRNEVLVLCTLLAKNATPNGRMAFVQGGLYADVLALVCYDSAKIVHPTILELELLGIALQCLLAMCKPRAAPAGPLIACHEHFGLVECLLACLGAIPSAMAPAGCAIATSHWADSQRVELRKRSLALLTNLCVVTPAIAAQHAPGLAALLCGFLSDEAPAELRDAAIQFLISVLPQCKPLQSAAGHAGCVRALVEAVAAIAYCGSPTSLAPFSTTLVATTASLRVPSGLTAGQMQAAVLCLGLLATDLGSNQERLGDAGGVACLLPLIRPTTEPGLLHAVIECVWSAVVPSAANVSKLLQRDGALRLLDVLEGAPFAPRAHLLSCLADLVAHPAALEQCQEWHGSQRQSAVQLCLQLWSEESARRGAASTAGGKLVSTTRPLSTSDAAASDALNASLMMAEDSRGGALAGGALPVGSLHLLTSTNLTMGGRLKGVGSGVASAALEKVDCRAKLFALLNALSFESSVPLTPDEEVLLTAAKAYVSFASAEAWQDAKDEFAAEGFDLLPEDKARLEAELEQAAAQAQKVLDNQLQLVDGMLATEEAQEAASLKRVRVLRDGPMYGVPKTKRATSLFRARIEAKARIAGMVAASKVAYRGPTPTRGEYADAVLKAASAALLEAGADPNSGFTLQHVPPALMAVATSAGIDSSLVTEFLKQSGIGLTATGKLQSDLASLQLDVGDGADLAHVNVKPLDKFKGRKVSAIELRQLCIAFQTDSGRS